MADEQWLKSNIMFGSAGMAASGMLPQPVAKTKPKPKPVVVEPIVEERVEEIAEEVPLAPVAVEEPEEEVIEVVAVQPTGYGINSKAQGLFTDLKVGILGAGQRNIHGCDWDSVFQNLPGLVVDGISDRDPSFLKELEDVYSFEGGYSDYRELLARTKPNLVVIPQLSTAHRYDIIKNCLMSGAHVICSAPFTRSLEDADELIALADRRGLKICVSYPMRLDPNVVRFHNMREEVIGELVEIRVFGDMDEASGGEDLLIKGGPLFDLVRMFAGNPIWGAATIFTDGSRSAREDIADDPESPWGPLVGDTINAQFYTEDHVMVTFVSNPKLKATAGGWGMEFVGSKNVMRLLGGDQPTFSLLKNPGEKSADLEEQWGIWPEHRNPYHPPVDDLEGAEAANRLVVADWLVGISEDRDPESSAKRATKVLEMIHSIFHSAMNGRRVYFPLPHRHHPLTKELKPFEVEYRESA